MAEYSATQVKETAFNELELETGVVLTEFNPENPKIDKTKIICATSGGISIDYNVDYEDFASDVDNAVNNTMEFKHPTDRTCEMSFDSISFTPEMIRMALGPADIDESSGKIIPRRDLKQSDFMDLWWVGDMADGGYAVAHIKNALSTGGFSMQTGKGEKGKISITMAGHVSLKNQDEMPADFYILEPKGEE